MLLWLSLPSGARSSVLLCYHMAVFIVTKTDILYAILSSLRFVEG